MMLMVVMVMVMTMLMIVKKAAGITSVVVCLMYSIMKLFLLITL